MTSNLDSGLSNELQSLTSRAWKIYKSLSNAPEALRDLQNGILSIVGALRLIYEYSQDHAFSATDLRTLQDHMIRCGSVLSSLEASLNELRQQRGPPTMVANYSQKTIVQGAKMSSFYEILRRSTQDKITSSLESLRADNPETFENLISGGWSSVLTELSNRGLNQTLLEEEYFFIDDWLKRLRINGADGTRVTQTIDMVSEKLVVPETSTSNNNSARSSSESTSQAGPSSSSAPRIPLLPAEPMIDEELPGYTPSSKPTTLAEKSRSVEQTTAILNAEASIDGPSSSSAPPAYTFEDGSDEAMDQELSRYIRSATANELKRRYQDLKANPGRGAYPWSWLPKNFQQQFSGRPEVESVLDANSFSVMAYETAPHYVTETEQLLPLLRLSSDGAGDDTIFTEGTKTLKTMISALVRFVVIQDQRPGDEHFSDLDAIDYAYDTAKAYDARIKSGVDHRAKFPIESFELAQKSYYNVLTFAMGMLYMFRDIFQGRTYVTRSREELNRLWIERRVSARTVWLQKQLAGWDKVENAVLMVRDWARVRPYQDQALTALLNWKSSVDMLTAFPSDTIKLTLFRGWDIPKTRNVQIKVILFNHSPRGIKWTERTFEAETAIQKSSSPEFNEHFEFPCPARPRYIDLMINDMGLMGRWIGRVRLDFRYVPGVELSLNEKSLMYGYDECLTVPVSLSEQLKGKDREGSGARLDLRLQWTGRYTLLEEAGLPATPPGKMFKKAISDIPIPFEEDFDSLSATSHNAGGSRAPQIRFPSHSTPGSSSVALDDAWEATSRISQQSSRKHG